jgi:hypothetical protein
MRTRPAARSHRQKAAILARFKGNNTRRPLFFSACVGIVLANDIPVRKISRREVGEWSCVLLSDCKRQSSNNSRGDIRHSAPALDFFRATSQAGECTW